MAQVDCIMWAVFPVLDYPTHGANTLQTLRISPFRNQPGVAIEP